MNQYGWSLSHNILREFSLSLSLSLARFVARILGGICLLIVVCLPGQRAYGAGLPSAFLDMNFYPHLTDVAGDTSLTINTGSKLTDRLSYFGFINFLNDPESPELSDFKGYYSEQNVRWKVGQFSPLDLTSQMNLRSGNGNDRLRLGLRWRLHDTASLKPFFEHLGLKYSINWHAVQIDDEKGHAWQLEHAFRFNVSELLYVSGFVDHNFNGEPIKGVPANPIVAEVQMGYRIVENFYAVAEWRLNQYRRSDVNNLAIGVEYKFRW